MNRVKLGNVLVVWVVVGVVFLVNLICKVYGLQDSGLYGDEPFTLFYSQQSLAEIFNVLKNDSNPFLHPLILHFWLKIFGVTAFAGKLYSVIVSSLTAALIFKLFYKRFGLLFPLLAAILFSVSGYQYFYAREMRAFAQVGLLTILSIYLFIEVIYDPKRKHIFLLGLTNLCLVMSHYVAFLLPVVEAMAAFMFIRTNRKGFWYFIMSGLFAAMLFAPWFFYTVMHHVPSAGKSWLPIADWDRAWQLAHRIGTEVLVWTHLFAILALIPLKYFNFFVKRFDYRLFLFFSGIFWVSLFINYWISQNHPIMQYRYLLFAGIGLFMAVAYFISGLRLKSGYLLTISLVVIAIKVLDYQEPPMRENWPQKVERIKNERIRKSLIFIHAVWEYKPFTYYYDADIFKDYKKIRHRLWDEHVIPIYGTGNITKFIRNYKPEEIFFVKNQGNPAKTFIDTIKHNGFEQKWSDKNKFPHVYKFKRITE